MLAEVRPEGPKSPGGGSKAGENRPKPTDSLHILKSSVNDSSDGICEHSYAAVSKQVLTAKQITEKVQSLVNQLEEVVEDDAS